MSFISGITEQSFIKAYTNHLGVPIVISGLLIAFSKICSLHRREISSLHVLSLHSPHEGCREKSPSYLESLNHSLVTDERKKWTIITAYTNHLGVPIVISGFLIAFSKICSLHRREISSLHVLSLHSPHEGFRAKSPSYLKSLNHSLVTDERKKWTIIKAYTNHLGVPIVISALLIAFSKIWRGGKEIKSS